MRIALVHAFAWPEVRRGGERLVDDLTAYLRASGHTADAYCGTRRESRFHMAPHGRSYRLQIPWIRGLGSLGLSRVETFGLRALVPLILHRYDVVHAFTPTAALAAVAAAQPTLYTVLGHPTREGLPESAVQRTTIEQAVGRATEVAALSGSAADAITATFGRRPIILPPGIHVDAFAPNLAQRSGPPRLLFSGDLSNKHKGLPVLLAAFERILDRHPGARLALSGPGRADWALQEIGEVRERIEGSLDTLGTGSVDDVPERYRSAHVTVLPSHDEAFGLVVVESLACGTPVVACTPGGPADVITDDVGRLVPFGDPERLADAIDACLQLASSPATVERCRVHAAGWDWSVIGPRYEAAYASIAGRRIRQGARPARSAVRPSHR